MCGVPRSVNEPTRPLVRAARCVALLPFACLLLEACAAGPRQSARNVAAPTSAYAQPTRSNSTVLTETELASTTAQTTLEALRQLRPEFLYASPRNAAPRNRSLSVYIGDNYLGDISMLAAIPISQVGEIRYLHPLDAVEQLGADCRCSSGVILIRWRK